MDANVTDSAMRVRWKGDYSTNSATNKKSVVTLPEYFKLVKNGNDQVGQWMAVPAVEVPKETGLARVDFRNVDKRIPVAYLTPEEKESSWKTPAPPPDHLRPGWVMAAT